MRVGDLSLWMTADESANELPTTVAFLTDTSRRTLLRWRPRIFDTEGDGLRDEAVGPRASQWGWVSTS